MTRLREITWPEARTALPGRVVLLPVGSVEQHGRHMPLATDHITAERVALLAEARLAAAGHDVLVAPTLPYGISPHHRQFWGTVWLRSEVFRDCVLDIARSLKTHGVERLVVVNGHGGNSATLGEVAQALRQELLAVAVFDWWKCLGEDLVREVLGDEAAAITGHACAMETSVGLHLFPEWMRPEAAVDVRSAWAPPVHGGQVHFDTVDFTPHGNIGFPSLASPKAGERLIETSVVNLVELVRWLEAQPLAKLVARPHLD
jgi:creatinine amidohydrolase